MRSRLPTSCVLLAALSLATRAFGEESPFDVEEAVTLALEDLASIEPQVRVRGANSLSKLGAAASRAVPQLAKALSDEPEVFDAALDALHRISKTNPAIARELKPLMPKLVSLLGEADQNQAFEALQLLEAMGPCVAVMAPELRLALERTRFKAVCCDTCCLLAMLGEPGLAELIRATHSTDKAARRYATHFILANPCQTEEAASMLAGVVRCHKDPRVRSAALKALGGSGPKAKIAVHDISRAADDPETVRDAMQAILSVTSDPKHCVPVLLTGYYQHLDFEVRFKAIRELRRFPRHAGVQAAFIDAIWDEQSGYTQLLAIQSLRDCPDVDTWARHLLPILDEQGEDWQPIQAAAAATLTAVGYRTDLSVPFLLRAIAKFDEDTARESLSHEDWEFCPELAAAQALARLNPRAKEARRAIAVLEKVLACEGGIRASALRAEAAMALFELSPDKRARGDLLRDLMAARGPYWVFGPGRDRIRGFLVRSGIDMDLTVRVLIETLEGPWPDDAVCAADTLASMGSVASAALPALEDRLRSGDADLRAAAYAAIARIQAAQASDGDVAASP